MNAGRSAVVIPGARYGPLAGLLAYVGEAALRRDAAVELISWRPPQDLVLEEAARWVSGQVTPVVAKLARPVLIGKSLGSFGAAVAADRGLAGV
ncbi:hypothetical protein [Nonomuraea aridisoli]|uniref:hypothetical protein n=1 Tax=Nonomuraea aridisoli TaxID=2070368 RepID=UPI001C64B5BF|nr:hypothetical protein [Nonomuraea aridisoli]